MDELKKINDYLAEIRRAGAADAIRLAKQGKNVAGLREIAEKATTMQGGFVLRYGIVGDSNAGKSRLIGGLIGKADALPVNPYPFTGNIAILRVRSDAALTSTVLDSYRLRFLSAKDARACFAHLLDHFLRELDTISGMSALVRSGREQKQRLGQDSAPGQLTAWLETTWKAVVEQGVDVRLRLAELARFVLAWDSLGKAACGQEEAELVVPVSKEVAEAAMVLPKIPTYPTFDSFAGEMNRTLAKATGGVRLDALPRAIAKELAEVSYPLIRDVQIDVRMPTAVWDLRDLKVDAIELFDFPGMGGQKNAARDGFLARLEQKMNRIHTWVIVVNSSELKGCQALEIIKELPPERVVAVANRFDDLPIWNDGQIEELNRLTAPEAPPRNQEEVLNHLQLLTDLTTLVGMVTKPERCVFVSAMLGLFELDQTVPVKNNVLSAEQRKNWVPTIRRGQEVQQKWYLLAAKMRSVDPEARLADWLETYAQRGGQAGLTHLRKVLFEHANHIGLQQLTADLKSKVPALNDSIRAWIARMQKSGEDSQAKADALRARLDQLVDTYREHGNCPGSIDALLVRPNGPCTNGKLDPETRIVAPAGTMPRPISEMIRNEVLMQVWEWPVWQVLLAAVRPDGFVAPGMVGGKRVGVVEDKNSEPQEPWDVPQKTNPPVRVGELHRPFRETYHAAERIAVAALQSALSDFLASISARLSSFGNELGPLAQSNPQSVINSAIRLQDGPNVTYFFAGINSAAPADTEADLFWRYRFPFLVYPDDKGILSLGQFFGWAPERRDGSLYATDHQMYVFRLRAELTAAMDSAIARHISACLKRFRERFNKLKDHLQNAVKDLKAQSNANLLALFGKAASAAPAVRFEIGDLVYPF